MALLELASFEVRGHVIEAQAFVGEIVGEKQWSTTHVSGSGGGSTLDGRVDPISISSTTTTHNQIFVQGAEGEERVLRATNADVAVRPGHRVAILYGRLVGTTAWTAIALHNHSTNETAPLLGFSGMMEMGLFRPANSMRFQMWMWGPLFMVFNIVKTMMGFRAALSAQAARLRDLPASRA